MRIESMSHTLPMSNFDEYLPETNNTKKRHSPLLPNTITCIVCGPSNCGKTNVVFNLLFEPHGLKFANIYVFSKSLHQPKYKLLESVFENSGIGYFQFSDSDSVITPDEAESDSVMLFDDIACEKHDNIRSYFTMGRHKNIDSFYLGQTYSKIPKQLVRDNANLLVVFKQDEMNLRHIFTDHVTPDISFGDLKNICALAWKDKHGFVVIDKDSEITEGRYRIGFDRFVKDI